MDKEKNTSASQETSGDESNKTNPYGKWKALKEVGEEQEEEAGWVPFHHPYFHVVCENWSFFLWSMAELAQLWLEMLPKYNSFHNDYFK